MLDCLYLSCHSTLEHSEVKLFSELGYNIFSPGAYWDKQGDGMRPALPELDYDPDLVERWKKHEAVHPELDGKSYITREIAELFDVIIVMHMPQWITQNWENLRHAKRVIWRTIGQSVAGIEKSIKPFRERGLEIVRYSPMEANIPEFAGQDGLIRFYKDPEEYCGWTGEKERVVTIAQHMEERDSACNFRFFEETTQPFDRLLIGPGSDNLSFGTGKIPFDDMKQHLRESRAYFYTGTHPASYTLNFMEAWMTGTPMICVGPQHGNANYFAGHNLYEIPSLIKHGETGFVSDSKDQLREIITDLFENRAYANYISTKGRKEAVKHFDKGMIKKAWEAYLEKGRE